MIMKNMQILEICDLLNKSSITTTLNSDGKRLYYTISSIEWEIRKGRNSLIFSAVTFDPRLSEISRISQVLNQLNMDLPIGLIAAFPQNNNITIMYKYSLINVIPMEPTPFLQLVHLLDEWGQKTFLFYPHLTGLDK